MSNLTRTLGTLALAMAGLGLQAEDFQPLMKVIKTSWPEKTHIGVICDYRGTANQEAVALLADAAGSTFMITVADARNSDQAQRGAAALANRKTDVLVLLPHDLIAGEGTSSAIRAVRRCALDGIPTVGTTTRAISYGALFSIGEGTEGQLLVNTNQVGLVGPITGLPLSSKSAMSLGSQGKARITVFGPK